MFGSVRFCAATLALLLYVSIVTVANGDRFLIRPLDVYRGLIKGVHDHFNNTCVILFHGSSFGLIEKEGLHELDGLLRLQRYFSGELNVRTAIMDLRTLESRVGTSYYRIKRPLFVLLNDLEEIREQFALVSRWIAMAYPTWLLFLRDTTRVDQFLSNVYVPFDSVLMVAQRDVEGTGEIVRDVYRIGRWDELRSMPFGTWTSAQGFRGPRLGLYQRRRDLHGRDLRVVAVHDPPVTRILRDKSNRMVGIAGFFGEVIQLLQEGMNCTFSYKEADTWGVRLPNGTWTGSMRMLVEEEADLAAMELMMTSDRLDAVKFTTPVYTTKCRVYIKRPDSAAIKWTAYLAPFAFNTWNAVGLTIAIAGLAIAGIDAFSRRSSESSSAGRPPSSPFGLLEILFHVFGAFCGQGMTPSTLDPVRLVQLTVHSTAVVVLAAYSAALISYLAVKTFAMPFTTMEGLLADGTYRFAVVADSADYGFFQNTTDPVLTVMFEELLTRETDLPSNYLDGLTRVCRENNYAFMTLDNMAGVLQGKMECALEPLDAMMQTTIAMAMPARSPYRGIIDSNILLLRDSGILQRLLRIERSIDGQWGKTGWSSVELEDAVPLIVFLLSALLLTWLALLAERCVWRTRDRGLLATEN